MADEDRRPGNDAPSASPGQALRRRAEEFVGEKAAQSPEDPEAMSPEETRHTLHELRVHQVELEIQNEELRRAQTELVAARARYFDLYDMAPVGYCSVSEQGLILEANLTAATLLGVIRGALVRQRITRFILKADEDIFYLLRKQLFKSGEPQSGELRMVKKDGTAFWADLAATAAQDANGAPVAHMVFKDITQRKLAEAEVRQLNEELEQRVVARTAKLAAANQELESFSYSVSHDLRAPLRAIGGFAEILARRYRDSLDEKGRHYLDTIVDSSNRMGILIEELLDYARLGRNTVRAEPVPLGPLVTGLRSMFGERMAASGVEFEVVEPLAVPLGDPMLLERILANLVDNALTYRRPDVAPHVTLSATRHGRTVTVAVADNGIGIPVEYREKVFEVFARLHTEEEYPGTGVGLSIVRKVARLMDGDVTIESTNGVGSTFTVTLPAAKERRTPS